MTTRTMTPEEFEEYRRTLTEAINATAADRDVLEAEFGQVWDTEQLRAEFDVEGFLAPFCIVVRKADGVKGALFFQHMPRFYWGFDPL